MTTEDTPDFNVLIFDQLASAAAPLAELPPPQFQVPRAENAWKRQYLKSVREVWGLNTPAWLAAQVGQESSWRDGLVSTAAARGMCQSIEATVIGIEC